MWNPFNRNTISNSSASKRSLQLITQKGMPFAYVEAYKALRTNLNFLSGSGDVHAFVVTSTVPEEAKSNVSVNLALALTESGKKVVLVDCDLRKPVLHRYLKAGHNLKGVSNVLSRQVALSDALVELKDIPNLTFLARYGGDVAVGAMTVITSVSQLCTMPIQGICQGGQPVMSFNFGAGKKPRVKEAFRFQLTLCFGYTTLFWLLMMLVPGVVAGIFTSDAALIEYTTWAMRIYMAGILAMGVQIACQQSFMALGQAKVSLLLACLRKIILLIPLIFILPCFTADKCLGVFLAEPVSDILAATITAITFFSRFDKILDKGAGKV